MDNVRKAIYSMLKEDVDKRPINFFTIPKEESNVALLHAVFKANIPMIRMALKSGADIHYQNDQPLNDACYYMSVPVMMELVELGADINSRDGNFIGRSTVYANTPLVKFALDHGADPNADGSWALNHASWFDGKNYQDIIDMLVKAGADIHNGLESPLCNAAMAQRAGTTQLLLHLGANPIDALKHLEKYGDKNPIQFLTKQIKVFRDKNPKGGAE